MKKSKLSGIYAALVLLFLYAPIIILIVFSFNSEKGYSWQGFSFKWYEELFHNELIIESFRNTLIVAAIASVFATVLGTLAAIGVYSMKNKAAKGIIQNVTNLPLLNPEIVTGLSLMLLFAAMRFSGGWVTLIIAHVTFCVPSVFLSILPKLRQLNVSLYEAAMDLGCTPFQTLYKVILPLSMSGIVSGVTMVLVPSISTFYISQKLGGGTFELIGDTIERQFVTGALNTGAAISLVMMILILISITVMNRLSDEDGGIVV